MGFRNLTLFNTAILAKQGWRLCTSPNSLASRILKAKYYRRSDFLAARRGYNPSFTWSSLWSAKSLLGEGIQWRIGNGSTVQVWSDKWIPDGPSYRTPLPTEDPANPLHVAELIDFNNGTWDTDLLASHLHLADAARVSVIPLCSSQTPDTIMWAHSSNGELSVKSGYWFGMNGARVRTTPTIDERLWSMSWALNVPPKMRTFAWRALSGSLAVNALLAHRHIIPSSICARCGMLDETVAHACIFCPASALLWKRTAFAGFFEASPHSSYYDLALTIMQEKGKEGLEGMILISWAAWTARNMHIMANKPNQGRSCLSSLANFTKEYKNYGRTTTLGGALPTHPTSWCPPPHGSMKVNTDAAVFDSGGIGMGAVIRDSFGSIIAVATRRLNVVWTPDIVEAEGIRLGITTAINLGLQDVWFESDALPIVLAVNNSKPNRTYLGSIIHDIRTLSSSFFSFKLTFVKHSGNFVAHHAARLSPQGGPDSLYLSSFPTSLMDLADNI